MMLPLKVAIGLMTGLGAEEHDKKLEDGWNREGLTTSDGSPEEKKRKEEKNKRGVGREPHASSLDDLRELSRLQSSARVDVLER